MLVNIKLILNLRYLGKAIVLTLLFAVFINPLAVAGQVSIDKKSKAFEKLSKVFGGNLYICSTASNDNYFILSGDEFAKKLLEQNKDNLEYQKNIKFAVDAIDYIASSFELEASLTPQQIAYKLFSEEVSHRFLAKFTTSQSPPLIS